MSETLSNAISESNYAGQTSFRSLVLDDFGEASPAGFALSDFRFTGLSWSSYDLGTLVVDAYTAESDTSVLSKTGAGSLAKYCSNTLQLQKLVASKSTSTEVDTLILKKGSTTVVGQASTSGTTKWDNESNNLTITFQSFDAVGIDEQAIDVSASFNGNFNGQKENDSPVAVTVDDQTTGGGGASFIVGTPILMADNIELEIENIMLDDILISGKLEGAPDTDDPSIFTQWGSDTMPSMSFQQSYVDDKLIKFVDKYYLINGLIGVTETHYIFVKDSIDNIYKWKYVGDIIIGDIMIDKNSDEIEIISKVLIEDDIMVVSLDVEEVDTYFAHGVLVYNAGL